MKGKSSILALLMPTGDTAKTYSTSEIKSWQPHHGKLWVHLGPDNIHLLKSLKTAGHITAQIISQLTDEDVRTKVNQTSSDFFCILRTLNTEKDDLEEMISIRIYMTEHLIVTYMFHHKKLLPIQKELQNQNAPLDTQQVFSHICNYIIDEITEHTEQLGDEVDIIETNLIEKYSETEQHHITSLQRRLLTLRRFLLPLKNTFLNCLDESSGFLNSKTRLQLQSKVDKLLRAIENLELFKEKCFLFIQTSSNQLSNELNKRMYLFSLIATIFLPISAISGIFGMNVGGMVWLNSPHGFLYTLAITVACSSALVLGLKIKKLL